MEGKKGVGEGEKKIESKIFSIYQIHREKLGVGVRGGGKKGGEKN
jgi:hypothetical protein